MLKNLLSNFCTIFQLISFTALQVISLFGGINDNYLMQNRSCKMDDQKFPTKNLLIIAPFELQCDHHIK